MKPEPITLQVIIDTERGEGCLFIWDPRKPDAITGNPNCHTIAYSHYELDGNCIVGTVEANPYHAPQGTFVIPGDSHQEAMIMVAHTVMLHMLVEASAENECHLSVLLDQ